MDDLSEMAERQEQAQGWLRYWHVLLVLVIQLIGIGIIYGRTSQALDDLGKRVTSIEENKAVTREEFEGLRTDMRDRFDHLEQQLLDNEVNGLK